MKSLTIDDRTFEDLRDFIEDHSGIRVGDSKRYLFEVRLSEIAQGAGCGDFGTLLDRLRSEPEGELTAQIVDAMTTNETLWFRDAGPWTILREAFLPGLCEEIEAGTRQNVRIWSAACSTGQEPYSIAITILEYLHETDLSRLASRFRIHATDLSPSALFAARAARYHGMAIERGLTEERRACCFDRGEAGWTVRSGIRDMVEFAQRNLTDPFDDLEAFDVIFCRNVLIYFSSDTKRDIVARMAARLKPGAGLVLGASESLQGMMAGFEMRQCQGDFYYVRSEGGRR